MNVEEIKRKTMDLLGTDDASDVAYITHEYLDANFEEEADLENFVELGEDGKSRVVVYGHNMSYCWRGDEYNYCYERGIDPASDLRNACGGRKRRLPFSQWDHEVTSRSCTGSDKIIRFVKK